MTWNLLYLLDLFAISVFLISYWRNCYRRGYRLDFWHFNLFLGCVFPNLLMLPMAKNQLNGIVLGRDYEAVMAVLPMAFLITILGFFSIVAGGNFWRLSLGIGLRKSIIPVMEFPFRCSMMLMSSRDVLLIQALGCLFLQFIILAIFFTHSGFGFDLRTYTFANPGLRPLALLASNYSIVIASHCLARYIDTRERILLTCTILLSLGLVFFGARSSILAIYLGILICYLVKLRARVNLFKFFCFAFVIVILILYLGNVRAGQYSVSTFVGGIIFLVFFGNTFSDLRDFAWVYAGWNHNFWIGKTYLAALMAFIPRVASGFRDNWSLGAATAITVGFDPQVHPGLRPGIFGEGYFNFGIPGVIFVGLMLGIVTRRVDTDVKVALAGPHPSMMKAFASTTVLGVANNFALSAGFSGLYILAAIFIFSWFLVGLIDLIRPRRAAAA